MKYAAYSPFIKTKRGEAKALKELDSRIKNAIFPLFDVLALNKGVTTELDVQEHLDKQIRMIVLAWADQDACYVDLFDINPSARALDGVHPLTYVSGQLDQKKVSFLPVAGLARDMNYLLMLRSVVSNGCPGIAIRLEVEDLLLPEGLNQKIQTLLSQVGALSLPLHILIDCRSLIGQDLARVKSAIRVVLPQLRLLNPKRMILSASSMVADMSKFKKNSLNRVKRDDFSLWLGFAKEFPELGFGDYGVIHPDYVDLDPRVIKPSAKIRYATPTEWLVLKGSRWVDNTSQHHFLSVELAKCSEYRGEDSWGGHYIETAVAGRPKYGTLETWVTVDQNSHITVTAKLVEKVFMNIQRSVANKESAY
jgi:hypothetical protein